MLKLRLFLENRDAGFQIGLGDIGNQSPFKAGAQPLFQCRDVLWRLIGGNDDLLARLIERIEGVEEFLLRLLLACDELDIVHHQHVHIAVAVAELKVRV